jgi:hypothetical protein
MKRAFAFIEEIFSVVMSRSDPDRRARQQQLRRERLLQILATSTSVKEFVRHNGKERIRIFHTPDGTFGAVFESADRKAGWTAENLIGPGAVYDSAAATESQVFEAIHALGWKNAWQLL